MRLNRLAATLILSLALAPASASALHELVPGAGLPPGLTAGLSMDAKAADLDGDGDVDLVVAMEWAPHLILLNDGRGGFRDASARVPGRAVSNGAVAVDIDADGDLDLVIANAGADEILVNDG